MKDKRGIYPKYHVARLSDPVGKHNECNYFVLDPQHDPHAKKALEAYAESCQANYPVLATELRGWLERVDETS